MKMKTFKIICAVAFVIELLGTIYMAYSSHVQNNIQITLMNF